MQQLRLHLGTGPGVHVGLYMGAYLGKGTYWQFFMS